MITELLAPYTGEVCTWCGALLRVDHPSDRVCAKCQEEADAQSGFTTLADTVQVDTDIP